MHYLFNFIRRKKYDKSYTSHNEYTMTNIAKMRFACSRKKINTDKSIGNTSITKKNSLRFLVLYFNKGDNPINCIIITTKTMETM